MPTYPEPLGPGNGGREGTGPCPALIREGFLEEVLPNITPSSQDKGLSATPLPSVFGPGLPAGCVCELAACQPGRARQ